MIAEEPVLLVDDEENLLSGLRRQLRGKFEVFTAEGGDQALEMLEHQSEIGVIVADMHMPGMTGLELLEAFSNKSPTTTRIMLTGNANQDCAVEAINKSHVFGFLNKPCSTDNLIEGIEGGLVYHRLLVRERKMMEMTLAGSIKLLSDVISLMDPAATAGSRKISKWGGKLSPHLSGVAPWELNFATMLAPIGRVSVPLDVLLRHSKGEIQSAEERSILANAPGVGSRLLNNIPRMATVSKAILYQDKNFDGSGFPDDNIQGADIPVIGRVLRILKELAQISGNSDLTGTNFDELLQQKKWFDPELVRLARQHLIARETVTEESIAPETAIEESNAPETATEESKAPETEKVRNALLREGHRLAEDLYNIEGALLLSKGTVLSLTQVEKIRTMVLLEKLHENSLVFVPR